MCRSWSHDIVKEPVSANIPHLCTRTQIKKEKFFLVLKANVLFISIKFLAGQTFCRLLYFYLFLRDFRNTAAKRLRMRSLRLFPVSNLLCLCSSFSFGVLSMITRSKIICTEQEHQLFWRRISSQWSRQTWLFTGNSALLPRVSLRIFCHSLLFHSLCTFFFVPCFYKTDRAE